MPPCTLHLNAIAKNGKRVAVASFNCRASQRHLSVAVANKKKGCKGSFTFQGYSGEKRKGRKKHYGNIPVGEPIVLCCQ